MADKKTLKTKSKSPKPKTSGSKASASKSKSKASAKPKMSANNKKMLKAAAAIAALSLAGGAAYKKRKDIKKVADSQVRLKPESLSGRLMKALGFGRVTDLQKKYNAQVEAGKEKETERLETLQKRNADAALKAAGSTNP